MRRIASGIALHDTRMLVDPLRTQSRSVLMGALILVTGLAGCFVFSLIRPNGQVGNNAVLADRSTAALYVRVGDAPASGAEPDLGPADRWQAGQPHHGEKH